MYNTNFDVKYHDIEEELTFKLKNKKQEELTDNTVSEYEYSNQDILDICDKLYRDELTNVFYADNIGDDKIDIGIKYISQKMLDNNEIKIIFNTIKDQFFQKDYFNYLEHNEAVKKNFEENSDLKFKLLLFQKEFFYIYHKCICQQLTLGTIEQHLLDDLKKIVIFNV